MTDIQQARHVREIKALSGVVAALSLPVYGSAAFFSAWDARFVSFYVGSVVLTIAVGLQIYARRPSAFGVKEIGDSLRTSYAVPAPTSQQLPPAQPIVPLAHPYALRTPGRVTRREVLQQCAIVIGIVAIYAVVVVAAVWILAVSPTWAFFAAAAVILAAAFWIGRAFAVGASAPVSPTAITTKNVEAMATPTTPAPHAA